MSNTLTVWQTRKLNAAAREKLLRVLLDSFDEVKVTALYGEEEVITSGSIVRGEGKRSSGNKVIIRTDICTG